MERKVIYIGKTNDYTFRENIEQNSHGRTIKSIDIDGTKMYQVEFDNGIIATIDKDILSFI